MIGWVSCTEFIGFSVVANRRNQTHNYKKKTEKASLLTLYCSWFAHCLVITSSIVNVWIVGYWQRGPVHCVKGIL